MRNEIGQGVTEPADGGHQSAHGAAQPWRAAAGERAVVGQSLGKSHGNAGADRRRQADQERRPGLVGGKGRREQRRQRRHRAVHQADKSRLHELQHEHAARGLVFLFARALGEDGLAELVGEAFVAGFRFGKFDQQLPHRGVARAFGGLAVIALGLEFHVLGELAHVLEPERARQPRGLLGMQEALHVLAADQRQIFAELLAVEVEQHGAVVHLFLGHLVEYFRRGGERLAQAFGEATVDAAVLFLVGDGQRQHFLLGQVGKSFHEASFR